MRRKPTNCPTCGLVWDANHGRRYGYGYRELGARVWKCSRCQDVQKGAAVHHQSVFRT